LLAAIVWTMAQRASALDLASLEPAFASLQEYDWTSAHASFTQIRAAVGAAGKDPPLTPALESRLIEALKNCKSPAGRFWTCEWLGLIGTDSSVEALASLLGAEDSSHYAQGALTRIQTPRAAAALRAALKTTKGRIQQTLIGALGEMRDAESVPALTEFLKHSDEVVAAQAALSLGKIGTPSAGDALVAWAPQAPAGLADTANVALLAAADSLLSSGRNEESARLFSLLRQGERSPHVRAAALRGLMKARPSEACAQLEAALNGNDAAARKSMLALVPEVEGNQIATLLVSYLPKLSPPEQVMALNSLARKADPAARAGVLDMIRSSAAEVRLAALRAVGAVGHAGDVDLLAAHLADPSDDLSSAAGGALAALSGGKVDAAIIAAAAKAPEPVKARLYRVLGARNAASAATTLASDLANPSDSVRLAAIEALRTTGGLEQIPALLAALKAAKDDAHRAAAEESLARLCSQCGTAACDAVVAAMRGADIAARQAMLRLLPACPSPAGLQGIVAALDDPSTEIQDEAARSLSRWPDAAAMTPLRNLARGNRLNHHVLAVRGLFSLVRATDLPAAQKLEAIIEVWPLAKRLEERKLLLGAMSYVPSRAAMERVLQEVEDKQLGAEACGAAVRVGRKLLKTDEAFVRQAMQKVRALTRDATLKAAIDRILAGDDSEEVDPEEIIN
jgi:HEAT repeat protein